MALSLQELREEREAKVKEYRALLEKQSGTIEDKEVLAQFDALQDRILIVENNIALHENAIRNAKDELTNGRLIEHADSKSPKAAALLDKWMRGGDKALSAEDWTHIRNTMSTTTPAEGGYTVATEVAKSVIEAMKAFGGMREVAYVLPTAQGNPMTWPTSDGTAETGEILAENAGASDDDIEFGFKNLPVYKYSSKVVTVPIELLQDSVIDLESFVRSRIAQRLARITNTHFTVGDGSGKPLGIVPAVTVGKTGLAGQVATIIFEDLVDMEHSIDPAYRANGCKWMFNDTMFKVIKKLKDTQNRPIWLPDISGGAPTTILNYAFQINQDVAVPAASAKSLIFGDLSKYIIRDVMAMNYFRFDDSTYAKKGQVGFLAFLRSGGAYVDVGGAVKCYQHPAA